MSATCSDNKPVEAKRPTLFGLFAIRRPANDEVKLLLLIIAFAWHKNSYYPREKVAQLLSHG